jgi:hypothetical protein
MQYLDERHQLRVTIEAKECAIPADERARMQALLEPLGEAVQDFPGPELRLTVIFHPQTQVYHVEAKLKMPGQTLFTSAEHAYLDSAFRSSLDELIGRV